MKKYIFLFLFVFCAASAKSQAQEVWKKLAQVSFKTIFIAEQGYEMDVPVFSSEVEALEGKFVVLQGYMVPLKELRKDKFFVLSRYPFDKCYFCGAAGAETVAEISTKTNLTYTDKMLKIKGKLKLNRKDPDHLIYILEQAEVIN